MYQYFSSPSGAAGISHATGTVAWTYTGYGTVFGGTSGTIEITGVSYMVNLAGSAALYDTTHEAEIELSKGTGGTVLANIPFSWRIDTGVSHKLENRQFIFPEPITLEPNTIVNTRVAQSLAQAITYAGIKIFYRQYITPQNPPTVDLNTPADSSSTTDTTPDLTFTGTDLNSDDITYEVQVDTSSNFNSLLGGLSIVDSYSESNGDTTDSLYQTFNGYSQSFTGDGRQLDSIVLSLRRVGTPNTNLSVKIYEHSGTFGTSSLPTGSELATSDNVNAQTLNTSYSLIYFNFTNTNRITLDNGTNYVLVVENGYVNDSNYTQILSDSSSPSHSGNFGYRNDTTWTASSGKDLVFYVYGVDKYPLLQSFSSINSGFVGDPDNTDPYTSGQSIVYTVNATHGNISGNTSFKLTTSNEGLHWINPNNTQATDATYANTNDQTAFEWLHGFGLDTEIPDGATINGIEVRMVGHAGTSNSSALGVRLSWNSGSSNTGSTVTKTFDTGTDQVVTWGSPTDTWGRSWSKSEFSSNNFWVRAGQSSSGQDINIDSVSVRVFYSSDKTGSSVLSLGTYYWKVRGKDPSGSNTWGSWSSIRSFTVIESGEETFTRKSLLMLLGVA